jgi:hypothetical protein
MSSADGRLEVLDLDAEAWRTLEVKASVYNPRRGDMGWLYASMVYDAHHDKMLYMDCEGAAHPKTADVRNIWSLDCASRKLETLPVPANLARGHFTKMVYSPALDISLFTEKTGPYAYRMAGEDVFGKLASPPDLSIDMSSGKVKLSWQPAKAEGITGYAVYRGEASRFPKNFKKIGETKASETGFADETVQAGSKHAYRVYALRGDVQGRPSRLAYTQPIWVHGVVASVEDKDSVRVTWEKNPEPDVVGYNVYRAKGADMFEYRAFKYEKANAAPVKGEEYADKVDLSDGVARSYIVRAVNAFGVESGYSDLATTFPNPPEWVSMKELASGRVQVSWKPPERQKVVGVELWAVDKTDARISEKPITENVFEIDKKQMRWYQLRAVNVLGQAGFTSHQVVPGMGVQNCAFGKFTGFLPEDKVFRYSDYVPGGAMEGEK